MFPATMYVLHLEKHNMQKILKKHDILAFLDFKKWLKCIQATNYNGARTRTIMHISNLLILVTLKDRRSLPQFDLYRGRHKSHNKVAQWAEIISVGVF